MANLSAAISKILFVTVITGVFLFSGCTELHFGRKQNSQLYQPPPPVVDKLFENESLEIPYRNLLLSYEPGYPSGFHDISLDADVISLRYTSDTVDLPVYVTIVVFKNRAVASTSMGSALRSYIAGWKNSSLKNFEVGEFSEVEFNGHSAELRDVSAEGTNLKLYEWSKDKYVFIVLGPIVAGQDAALNISSLIRT